MVMTVEAVERCPTEALAASVAEQHEAVVGREAWWIVGEFKRWDCPRVDARASQQVLTHQGAVVAGPDADDENA
jgi:hypothetical protein